MESFEALIRRDNLYPRQTHRLRKLAFLAPDIVERIIAGDVPETLTLECLKKDFPTDWRAQREYFELSQATHSRLAKSRLEKIGDSYVNLTVSRSRLRNP